MGLDTSKIMSSSPSGLYIVNRVPEDDVTTLSPNDQTFTMLVLSWLLYGMNQKLKVAPSPPFRRPYDCRGSCKDKVDYRDLQVSRIQNSEPGVLVFQFRSATSVIAGQVPPWGVDEGKEAGTHQTTLQRCR